MSITSYFFDSVKDGEIYDRPYGAEDFTNYLRKIIGNGVFPNPSTSLQAAANSGMSVNIKAGEAWINGFKIVNDADETFLIDSSDVILSRIDIIVFYVDYVNRLMGIRVKKGNNSISPVAPMIQRDTNMYEMCLSQIKINKQITSITQDMITDTRMDSNVCGWVTGLIREIDTSTLFTQWQAAYSSAITADQSNFTDWFESVKDGLSISTLIRTFKSTYLTTVSEEKVIDIPLSQYVNGLDILEVYINGMRLSSAEYELSDRSITLTKALNIIGTPVEFVIYKCIDGKDAVTVIEQVEDLQSRVLALEESVKNNPGLQI